MATVFFSGATCRTWFLLLRGSRVSTTTVCFQSATTRSRRCSTNERDNKKWVTIYRLVKQHERGACVLFSAVRSKSRRISGDSIDVSFVSLFVFVGTCSRDDFPILLVDFTLPDKKRDLNYTISSYRLSKLEASLSDQICNSLRYYFHKSIVTKR